MLGNSDGRTPEQIANIIKYRVQQLRNVSEPFGKPSDASKKRVDSGLVTLRDGFAVKVEEADKSYVFAISNHFGIDEVEALTLLRSFLYNKGLSSISRPGEVQISELIEAFTPFYYAERVHVRRCLMHLFRLATTAENSMHAIASEYLEEIVPQTNDLAETVVAEYLKKLQLDLPKDLEVQPKKAAVWVKQIAKEQLALLEILLWAMWDRATCNGPLVESIYQAAYTTNLGSNQRNGALLMDEEGVQLGQDIAGLWILLTIEVLDLERLADSDEMEISDSPKDSDVYWTSPDTLQRLHHLITTNQNSQFACSYLAWAFVLSRLVKAASALKEIPKGYSRFFESLTSPADRAYQKDRQPVHKLMAQTCLQPEVGLLNLLMTLLTKSSLFVASLAWRSGSALTVTNALVFRSAVKGPFSCPLYIHALMNIRSRHRAD